VCHDSGKSEKEYTNHWVKDLNGKITCPTLLATECRYCYKLGHTAKFCPALKTKPSITKPKKQQPVKVRETEKIKTKNAFASLYCSDNEEDQDQDQHEDHEDQDQIPIKTGWASIVAAKAPEIKLPEGPNMVVLNRYTKYIPTPEPQPEQEQELVTSNNIEFNFYFLQDKYSQRRYQREMENDFEKFLDSSHDYEDDADIRDILDNVRYLNNRFMVVV